jgi:rhodanese-related sulfurtransferase
MKKFDEYLRSFDYQGRKDMKIKTAKMLELFMQGRAQIVDIRFREEYQVWHLDGTVNIPLPELPDRLDELDKSKLIVTACPHNDRANMARVYLHLQGFNVRYLTDGLFTALSQLRGDAAKVYADFLERDDW